MCCFFSTHRIMILLTLSLLAVTSAAAEDTGDNIVSRAVTLYDQGDCEAALPLLEQLAASDEVDGSTLYRLYYCQLETEQPGARATMGRAREALRAEIATANDLATPFYLANVYRNAGQPGEARRVAAEAAAKVESGQWPEPTTGMECFRLGKLYADSGRADEAARWYETALGKLDADGLGHSPSARWAAHDLAGRAYEVGALEIAERYYARALDGGQPTMDELDRLAVVRVRLGDFAGSAEAWRRAILVNPALANRARYCLRLSAQLEELGGLRPTAPEERAWSDVSPQELEAMLMEQAQLAADIKARAGEAGEALTKKQRKEMTAQLLEARHVFVTAAMEYALRGGPIREVAFQSGYAPMVFHPSRWSLDEQ